MGGTQLTELPSNVRVIDVATAPFLSADECAQVVELLGEAYGLERPPRHEVESCLAHLQLEGIVR